MEGPAQREASVNRAHVGVDHRLPERVVCRALRVRIEGAGADVHLPSFSTGVASPSKEKPRAMPRP
eukprot:6509737-Pyramimonas_sp.AAC.1